MIFKDLLLTDAGKLFAKYANMSEEPVMVINSSYKIIFSNSSFQNFVQKDQNQIINENYGNALGCSVLDKDTHQCGFNYYCKLCKIRSAITECFENENAVVEEELVRDFNVNNEIIFRSFKFKTFSVKLHNENFVLVIIGKNSNDESTPINTF